MLDFPSEKHVVLLDAVIWQEHLRLFRFHVYTPVFYLFVLLCDGCRSFFAAAPDDVLQTYALVSFRRFSSTRLSLSTSSLLNITHPLAVFPALFVLLLPTRPPIRPLSARLPPTLPLERQGRKENRSAAMAPPRKQHAAGENLITLQTIRETDGSLLNSNHSFQ